jgi:2-polyprenyl-6-methoxyphenol hydroxylase-like FAD-dependent oxidoreductase
VWTKGKRRESLGSGAKGGCDGAHSTVRETIGIGFPGGTYEHLFYVADVEASGQALNGELHAAFDRTDFLVISRVETCRCVARAREDVAA